MDRWVGGRKFKLPRSKSPFNEKTIFVETERAKRERAFKFTRERLFVRSRARMGNQSTSKTSVPLSLSGAPIGANPPPRAPPQFNLLQNNFVDSARDLGKKLPRDPLSSSLRLPKRPSSRPLLMPRNRSGHIPPPPPPPLRRLAGSAAAASGSGGGRICKGFTSDLEGLRLIAS